MKDPDIRPNLQTGLILLTVLLIVLVAAFTSDVLGDFSAVEHDPGYLDFSPSSPAYKGNIGLSERIEGIRVEARMPARILFEDYVEPGTRLLNPDAILLTAENFQQTQSEHLQQYCESKIFESYVDDSTHIEAVRLMASPNKDLVDRAQQALNQRVEEDCRDVTSDIREAWEDRKDYTGYLFVQDRLEQEYELAINLVEQEITIDRFNEDIPDVLAFRRVLFEALEVYESLKLENVPISARSNNLRSVTGLASNYLKKQRIESGRPEATNLLIPADERADYPGQRFFSLDQLDAYTGDISLFNPPSSGFWRKPSWAISEFDLTNYNRMGVSSLRRSLEASGFESVDGYVAAILDADIPVDVVYEKEDLTGRTPKMTVKIGDQKWKLKYLTHRQDAGTSINPSKIYKKRYMGSEVNVEPVVNNLAASIGYTVDPTYYQKEIHLYFPEKVYTGTAQEQAEQFELARDKLLDDISSFYPDVNVPSAFQNVRQDDSGRRYIAVRGCTLEKKSDETSDINLGYFMWGGYGRSFKRAFRAFSVFLAWVNDPDIKNGNVKFKLIPVTLESGETTYRLGFSASDMGGALGAGLPNFLPRDLVDRLHIDRRGNVRSVALSYRSIYPATLLNAVSISDLRWIMRRIGQLRREQINDAFRYAGYPEVVARYYTEVLLRRRDQLLEAAQLLGETAIDDAGREVQFERLSQMNHSERFYIPGYESFFDSGWIYDPRNRLFDPDEERSYFPQYWGTRFPWQK